MEDAGKLRSLFFKPWSLIMIIVELTLWREGFQRAPDNLPALRLLLEGLQQKEMISTTKVTSEVMPLKRGEKDNV